MRWKAGSGPISSAMPERTASVRLVLVGGDALICLEAIAADGGSVLAVFRRSVYLIHEGSGAIACIGPPALGAGPLNALAEPDDVLPDWRETGLVQGDPVAPSGGGFRIGAVRFPALAGARLHEPPCGPFDWTTDGLVAAFALLSDALAGFELSQGLAPLVRLDDRAPSRGSLLIERALPAISTLSDWFGGDISGSPPRDAVERLIGLGPGLTPSGDDFLGGATIALSMSGYGESAAALARSALAAAADGTNRISQAHLRAAARGLGADALHLCIDALARGDGEALGAALGKLDAIGHSSGWDAMAGAIWALRAIGRRLASQPAASAAAVSAAPALDPATTTPASRSAST